MKKSIEVLVSTMNQNAETLVRKMKIDTNAIIINQNNKWDYKEYKNNKNIIKIFECKEKGIGLSRNTALMRSTADICLFADDDVVYENNYEEIVLNAFQELPEADVIIFNVPSTNKSRPSPKINKTKKIYKYNCLKYGTFSLAVKRKSIIKNNIYFSLLFGGGAPFGSGEDSLFIMDCIKMKLSVYVYPKKIGIVNHDSSTWFEGYNEKYFRDKGALFSQISKGFSKILCCQFLLRKYAVFNNDKNFNIIKSWKDMMIGVELINNYEKSI